MMLGDVAKRLKVEISEPPWMSTLAELCLHESPTLVMMQHSAKSVLLHVAFADDVTKCKCQG